MRKAVLLGVSAWISLVTVARQPALPYIALRCCLGIRESEAHQGHAGLLMTNDNHRACYVRAILSDILPESTASYPSDELR